MNTFHYNFTWPIGKVKGFEKGVDIHCIKFRWVYSSRISCMWVLDRSCLLQGMSWKICILTLTNVSVIIIQTLIAFNTQGAQGRFLSRFPSVPGSVLYLFFFIYLFFLERMMMKLTVGQPRSTRERVLTLAFPFKTGGTTSQHAVRLWFSSHVFDKKFQPYPSIQLA